MDKGYEKTLQIAAKKHDLTGIRVYDPREKSIPNIGLVPMQDSESGAVRWINTQSKAQRLRYEKHFQQLSQDFETIFKKNGAGTLSCSVEESYVKRLLGYFKARI